MRLKAVKRYVDKYTKNIVEEGTILDVVKEGRAKELIKEGVMQEIKDAEAEPKKKATVKQEG